MALLELDRSISRCRQIEKKRASRLFAPTFENDPGCVKTRLSQGPAELFSQFRSPRKRCQCIRFRQRRNRDRNSARNFNIGVFTQPGPEEDMTSSHVGSSEADFPYQSTCTRRTMPPPDPWGQA